MTHEYAFDVKLQAAIRVRANSEAEARATINDVLLDMDCNGGLWPDGSPILFEASIQDDTGVELYEVDDEPYVKPPEVFKHQYQFEFRGFPELDVTLPEGYEDTSWHNDACPSFTRELGDGRSLLVYIDWPDVTDREGAGPRFHLHVYTEEDWGSGTDIPSTDDWDEVVAWDASFRSAT